ncbi:MAG TPA: peptidylprolyl isomerase, partial [Herpetosiphonaceae bacterium]|nr:peptidylprolyl isomerase [Herpetosiphonaceae bacterium]
MRIIRFVLPLGLLLVAAACGTPTETGSTGNTGEGGSGAASAGTTAAEPGAAAESITPDATAMAAVVEEKARQQFAAPPPMTIDQAKSYTATIETTRGTMKADLFASEAPITVNNFVFLARENFYDGIRFHRVVKGFMVQT